MKYMNRVKEIKAILSEFHTSETGKMLRKELVEIYKEWYEPRYDTSKYVNFIQSFIEVGGNFSIDTVGDQSDNHHERYCLFTVPSQHIYGNSVEHLIDNALDAVSENAKIEGFQGNAAREFLSKYLVML